MGYSKKVALSKDSSSKVWKILRIRTSLIMLENSKTIRNMVTASDGLKTALCTLETGNLESKMAKVPCTTRMAADTLVSGSKIKSMEKDKFTSLTVRASFKKTSLSLTRGKMDWNGSRE